MTKTGFESREVDECQLKEPTKERLPSQNAVQLTNTGLEGRWLSEPQLRWPMTRNILAEIADGRKNPGC